MTISGKNELSAQNKMELLLPEGKFNTLLYCAIITERASSIMFVFNRDFRYIYICIRQTIAKSGLCVHITHEFAVVLRRSRGRIGNEGVMPSA